MSIHILSSTIGYMAYEPKYIKSAVFVAGRFIGWKKAEVKRSMLACDVSLKETLKKAIQRKLKNSI